MKQQAMQFGEQSKIYQSQVEMLKNQQTTFSQQKQSEHETCLVEWQVREK